MKKLIILTACLLVFCKLSSAQNSISQPSSAKLQNEPVNVVTSFLEAVKEKNRAKALGQLHPHIEWQQPGNNRVSGVKKDTTEVLKMFGAFFKISSNTLKLEEVKSIAVNGSMVACLLRWTATQPNGKSLDVENIDVYTVENGKIIKAWIFSANLQMEDEFWGKD